MGNFGSRPLQSEEQPLESIQANSDDELERLRNECEERISSLKKNYRAELNKMWKREEDTSASLADAMHNTCTSIHKDIQMLKHTRNPARAKQLLIQLQSHASFLLQVARVAALPSLDGNLLHSRAMRSALAEICLNPVRMFRVYDYYAIQEMFVGYEQIQKVLENITKTILEIARTVRQGNDPKKYYLSIESFLKEINDSIYDMKYKQVSPTKEIDVPEFMDPLPLQKDLEEMVSVSSEGQVKIQIQQKEIDITKGKMGEIHPEYKVILSRKPDFSGNATAATASCVRCSKPILLGKEQK